jgi:hypothetical protein
MKTTIFDDVTPCSPVEFTYNLEKITASILRVISGLQIRPLRVQT